MEEEIWLTKINALRQNGRLCDWVTTFHPRQIPCRLDSNALNGSYNLGQKFLFEDGTAGLLRFPQIMGTNPDYADKKLTMEVEAVSLIRERTSIPISDIIAWGLADSNPLGLGPFILIEFIEGACLGKIFVDGEARLLKEDIPESDIEFVYRQMANIMLQLFDIDFDRIGSLPTPKNGVFCTYTPADVEDT